MAAQPVPDPLIAVVGVVAISYSAAGGLGAVVYTDALQLLFIVVGLFGCFHVLLGEIPGGLGAVFEKGGTWLDADPSLQKFPTGLSAAIAYGVLVLSVAGTNQQNVQRYLACKDLATSRQRKKRWRNRIGVPPTSKSRSCR